MLSKLQQTYEMNDEKTGLETCKPLKVSIVTPSFNQGIYLERTLLSVVNQGYPLVEHMVFDGGSTDDSLNILRRYDEHLTFWESKPDRGQTHAVNKGFKMATGDIIGWLNSDDVYYQGALQKVTDFFANNPDVNFVYGMADHIDSSDHVLESYYTEDWNYQRLQHLCFICQPAVFFRKSVLSKYGLLDEGLNYCMDYEYWLRCGLHEEFVFLKQTLAGSRLYPENKTIGSRLAVLEEIVTMLSNKFDKVDDQWIASYSLEQSRSKFDNNGGGLALVIGAIYAVFAWWKTLWTVNRTIFPLLPHQYLKQLATLPSRALRLLTRAHRK